MGCCPRAQNMGKHQKLLLYFSQVLHMSRKAFVQAPPARCVILLSHYALKIWSNTQEVQ